MDRPRERYVPWGAARSRVFSSSQASLEENIANIETLNPGATVGAQLVPRHQRRCTARQTPLPDESRIDVGPMNHGVAGDAGRTVCRSCVHPMDRAGGDRAMALVA